MSSQFITIKEGKLKGTKLNSLWLRERLSGEDYVDQNNKSGSIIKKMHVSDEGELITQWPKGFFSNDIDEIFDF